MEESLPIVVKTSALFDKNDDKSSFLLEKLQAWINFVALSAQWFADESKVINIHITLMPEKPFLALPQQNSDSWIKISEAGLTGLKKCATGDSYFEAIIAINNQDLKEMMENGTIVEPQLQSLLMVACNHLTAHLSLQKLL
ncbi:hypothetical protein N9L48_03540 [Psychrosphaera sp.]|nr:hypothetical protein [Psychrosphaera sp.]